ncbi:MAG TPA: hypothetical protein VF480_00380 [Verrucomicrobiae bacterium]
MAHLHRLTMASKPAGPNLYHLLEVLGKEKVMRDVHADNGSRIENESAIDDLADIPEGSDVPDRAKKIVTQVVIKRDNLVRACALKRADGRWARRSRP